MLNKVKKTIQEYALLNRGDRVLLAVSGGPDSMALFKAMILLAPEYGLSLAAAHLNHGIRGAEADRDEDFVRTQCRDAGMPFLSKKADVPALRRRGGGSLEDICRKERFAFLKEAAEGFSAAKIALGHHMQDQAETVIMNFLRGSGSEGLRGMLPLREGIFIRPLLQVTRQEVLTFLEKSGVTYITDSSNTEDLYLRNRIRRHLLPLLKEEYNPRLEKNLSHLAEIMRIDDEYMELAAQAFLSRHGILTQAGEARISVAEFVRLHEAVQRRAIKNLLVLLSPGKTVGYRHVMDVAALAKGKRGSGSLHLPGGLTVQREYDLMIFSSHYPLGAYGNARAAVASGRHGPDFLYPVEIPGRIRVEEAGLNISFRVAERASSRRLPSDNSGAACMDYEALVPPLVVRNALPGDRIRPLGMAGTKKLKALFIDEKVPVRLRRRIPLLADSRSVLWVAGLRISDAVKVTEKTRRVLEIEII